MLSEKHTDIRRRRLTMKRRPARLKAQELSARRQRCLLRH
nr:MAG TPA: hypothetical protein [Caudoviricetes sp.]DAW21068.1 MAG TPA: hypothetical protein [Caudoviricetes sp.]